MSEFFAGYLPTPPGLARFVRRVIAVLGLLAVTVALLLVRGQEPFASSAFEFGKVRTFEGIVSAYPYPTLLVSRPGASDATTIYSQYLLVAAGKHGASDMVGNLDSRPVRLQGQLIYRTGGTMIEINPGAITATGPAIDLDRRIQNLGTVTLSGEIVDSKCYLGVMNPGQGKVHRDCAARCLSGGVPPLFIDSRDGSQFLLVGLDGTALRPDELREYVAEPVTVSGHLVQRGEQKLLLIDPANLHHTPDRSQ